MDKFKVYFTAENQQLTATGTKHASDTYADIEATFTLGAKWADMDSVSAVWWNDFTRIATVLDSDGKCFVPHEVLERKGCVRVNLVGSIVENGELVVRLTSYSAEAVHVNEKIKLTGTETAEVTPSQFEQFVADVKSDAKRAEDARDLAKTYADQASVSASDADISASNALSYASNAYGYAQTADGAKRATEQMTAQAYQYMNDAKQAKTDAETARDDAETSANNASASAESANIYQSWASDYANNAQSYANDANNSKWSASVSASDAKASADKAESAVQELKDIEATATTLPSGSSATASYDDGLLSLGIPKGDTGATPQLSVGTVETLEPTEDATVTITGTAKNPVLNFGLPKGEQGDVNLNQLYALYPTDTASGDVAIFTDGADDIPLKSLKIKLEPRQDLSNGQPSADNVAPIYGWNRVGIYDNVKRYGVKWNGVDNVCTERLFDAKDITLDTTNFCDHGVTNPNYNNPFDNIYPWSEMKQCNVDLTMYRSGNYSLKECITAWYGDSGFVTEGSDTVFVGRYRPEFWHTRYTDEDGNIYWVVAESEVNGYIHAGEAIDGIGFATDDGNGGVTCGDGQPLSDIAVSTIQTRARNSGMELQNIYSLDAQIVLYLVEYGNMNIQQALGNGCSNLYRQNASDIISAVNGNTITIPTGGQAMLTKGATLDVGASNGAVLLANRREVQGYVVDGNSLVITLDSPLDASVIGMYVSIHGSTNADLISDRSGYIGTDTKANVNYRGSLLYANRYQYTLGIYRQTGTSRIWLCDEDECINYNALNTSVHHDTGKTLPSLTASAWLTIGKLNFMEGVSTFAPIASSGGNSVSPVGDRQYMPFPTATNTILLFGGHSSSSWFCGAFCGSWGISSGRSGWDSSARPLLK